MDNPTVYIVIGGNACAFDASGEILEAEPKGDGTFHWDEAGTCDHRGSGGEAGYRLLHAALSAATENAALCGFNVATP